MWKWWLSLEIKTLSGKGEQVVLSVTQDDPMLERHRYDLIIAAARQLDKAKMVRFEERTGFLHSTDLGRIASHFYIKYDTVEVGLWV